jgi:RHS repeat-associated protein
MDGQGYEYDEAGNLTRDAQGRRFIYDGENKQVEVRDASNGVVGRYYYDGEGRRAKKEVPGTGETTIFVYDAFGKLIAEYSTQVAQPTEAKVSYLTSDHLGSPRVLTEQSGKVYSRRDFMPFGEEIRTPQRTQSLGYTADSVRQKFTSYERDIESGLDYAINRYYLIVVGRFTSVDPYNIIPEKEKGKDEEEKQKIFHNYISQPQIWNKYVYALNNPLKYTDPDGRRPLNEEDMKRLNRLGEEHEKALKAGNQELTKAIEESIDAITNFILAIPENQKDPIELKVAFYAIDRLGDARYGYNGKEMYIESAGWKITIPAESNKCNFFVAATYAIGGGIGLQSRNRPGGFPNNASITRPGFITGATNAPSANELAAGNVANFTPVSSPQVGNIVAFGSEGPNGHSAISLGGSLLIYAGSQGVKLGTINQNLPGHTNVQYLKYKP